jgi:uncharacterized membrane protein
MTINRFKNNDRDSTQKYLIYFILFLIILLGFGLRLYKLGDDSFWLDEAGQALAATQPNFADTLQVVREHAGAMPLDYLISRLMALISLTEGVMRFPSVLWGTLSIPLYFLFIREVSITRNDRVALFTALMLSISPLHIEYSQEMRFYSALLFFHVLSIFLLIRSVKYPSPKAWCLYIVATSIGVYFHPYVLLAIFIGALYIISIGRTSNNWIFYMRQNKSVILNFLLSSVLLILIFLPGYLFFEAGQVHNASLDRQINFMRFVMDGFGWRARHSSNNLAPIGLWHHFQFFGAIIGLLLAMVNFRKYKVVIFIVFGTFVEFVLIYGFDLYGHYFLAARQIIHLTPIIMLLVSIGIVELSEFFSMAFVQKAIMTFMAGILLICAFPYIRATYRYLKCDGREIASIIVSDYHNTQTIIVLPPENRVVFDYYFFLLEKPNLSLNIIPVTGTDEIQQLIAENQNVTFIVMPRSTNTATRKQIKQLGFTLIGTREGAEFLFSRTFPE